MKAEMAEKDLMVGDIRLKIQFLMASPTSGGRAQSFYAHELTQPQKANTPQTSCRSGPPADHVSLICLKV